MGIISKFIELWKWDCGLYWKIATIVSPILIIAGIIVKLVWLKWSLIAVGGVHLLTVIIFFVLIEIVGLFLI